MNIGVCVVHSEKSMDQSFQKIVDMGFHHCQLMSWNSSLWTDAEAKKILASMNKYGVTITAFWCGWCGPSMWNFYEGQETLGLVPVTFRYERMKDLMNGSDFAKKLGVIDVITHVGFIPENPLDQNYSGLITALKVVAGHMQQNGQYLLFETGQETPVTLLRAFEDIGTGNLGVNLDPANLVMYGKANPVDALDVFGSYVRGMHGKDGKYPTNGRNLGEEVPMGTGKVEFSILLKRLKELGYDGSITIEREIDGDEQIADIRAAKGYLESILNNL